MFKIALTAGHYKYTSGKRCPKKLDPNETREWTLNNRIADKIESLLKSYEGYSLLRTDDTTGEKAISVEDRTAAANKFGADIYISIHHNAGIEETVNGVRAKTTKKFYECVSTHCARRSWATNAYKRGVPLRSIMAVTGHTTEEMLRRYLKLTKEEAGLAAAKDLAKYFS